MYDEARKEKCHVLVAYERAICIHTGVSTNGGTTRPGKTEGRLKSCVHT